MFVKKKYSVLIIFIFIINTLSNAQSKDELKQITSTYNLEKLNALALKHKEKAKAQKENLIQKNKTYKLPFRTETNDVVRELIGFDKNNKPLHYSTFNAGASKSTGTNQLHTNGGLGLNLEGEGLTAGVWDAAIGFITHQEYATADGTSTRYSSGDGTANTLSHSSHVAGTICSKGVEAEAKGMAPKSIVVGYNWSNDLAEATLAAANGLLISNHSYGNLLTDVTNDELGSYRQDAHDWDDIMHSAPYYLMVAAAGNAGHLDATNLIPLDGNAAYDKISGFQCAKNTLTVANVWNDNITDVNGNFLRASRVHTSSEGPMDDYRVKPEISGVGGGLYSTGDDFADQYVTKNGTSMASPNVVGALLLLQEHYNNSNNQFMKAATAKGLALHTADNLDNDGPDATTGWGLINTKHAAELITNNGTTTLISEKTLNQNNSYSVTVTINNPTNLKASISWTDPAGVVRTTANDNSAVLINDLDIRITKDGTTFFPWRLTGVDTNDKGDNIKDNFERIDIDGAVGNYTITVSHKGNLTNNTQNYSLAITGINNILSTEDFNKEAFNKTTIYPNPTKGLVNLSIPEIGNYTASVYDQMGRKLSHQLFETIQVNDSSHQLNLSQYSKGIYFIKLSNGKHLKTFKVMLN